MNLDYDLPIKSVNKLYQGTSNEIYTIPIHGNSDNIEHYIPV